MEAVEIGSILVALIAALGAWAAQRSAARASTINTNVSGRLEAERGAYERARDFDIETIERQQEEMALMRVVEVELRAANDELREEIHRISNRLIYLEEDVIPDLERRVHGDHE